MSLLQRPPIDVSAVVGCDRAEAQLYRATTALMGASATHFPYVGALVRSAVQNPERDALANAPPEERRALFENASFLPHINRAMHDVWSRAPQAPNVAVTDVELAATRSDFGAQGHIDQMLDGDLPDWGPLSVLYIAKGATEYRLAVHRKDVFNPRHKKFFQTLHDDEPIFFKTVTARAGDVLITTNTPPTYHAARAIGDRLVGVYFSRFKRPEPVK